MKLLLLTNDNGTDGGNQNGYTTQFTCNFNQVINLPKNCKMCILAYTLRDDNAPKMHYLEISNLPLYTPVGNRNSGQVRSILGSMVSNGYYNATGGSEHNDQNLMNGMYEPRNLKWIDLNNPNEIPLTQLQCKITNQNGSESSSLSQTEPIEIMIGYK